MSKGTETKPEVSAQTKHIIDVPFVTFVKVWYL